MRLKNRFLFRPIERSAMISLDPKGVSVRLPFGLTAPSCQKGAPIWALTIDALVHLASILGAAAAKCGADYPLSEFHVVAPERKGI